MGLFEWWPGLPWYLRYGVAGALILVSTVLLIAGRLWPWGWAGGLVLLLFSGRSDSEKKGYHF